LAVDGDDAIEIQENKDRIQLLLLDVVMPKRTEEVYETIIVSEC
jgi:hypothetical protein